MATQDDHYAILVAIQRYPGMSNLYGPENDAHEIREWLLSPTGGNLRRDNLQEVVSSKYPPLQEPERADEANPAELEFKKALNRWLKVDNKTWRGRVGQRLYLYFAGHGFTAGSVEDPALYTAQAQTGDVAHIAAIRYVNKIVDARFFDEVIVIMDCCQDVLKASQVVEPTWSPPSPTRETEVLLMKAFAAPRGRKSFENPPKSPEARGYFSTVFMKALKAAPADSEGYVTARSVEETLLGEWVRGGYAKRTGISKPPIAAPLGLRIYRRGLPVGPLPLGDQPQDGAPFPILPRDMLGVDALIAHEGSQVPLPHVGSDKASISVTLETADMGASMFLSVGDRTLALGTGRMEIALPAGEYSVTASLGDDFLERTLTLSQDQPSAHIGFDAIAFSSPVPIAGTATNREYQAAGVGELRRIAAAHLAAAEVQPSAGAILIFARDSAHRDGTAWRMPAQLQAGLRLRRLYGGAAEPLTVEGLPFINIERGFSAALYPAAAPGTYLVGVRDSLDEGANWQEIVVTVAPGWRTEVFLDCVDDDQAERRFDVESASIVAVPRTSDEVADSLLRQTETARLSLLGGGAALDRRSESDNAKLAEQAPMAVLLNAYALTRSPGPDLAQIRSLCAMLRRTWTSWSADIKLLELWCSWKEGGKQAMPPFTFGPNEAPMVGRAWELLRQDGIAAKLAPHVQRQLGLWRTAGLQWTQTQVPNIELASRAEDLFVLKMGDSTARARELVGATAPSAALNPLQQMVRRAFLDTEGDGDDLVVSDIIGPIALGSAMDPMAVLVETNRLIPLELLKRELERESRKEARPVPSLRTRRPSPEVRAEEAVPVVKEIELEEPKEAYRSNTLEA